MTCSVFYRRSSAFIGGNHWIRAGRTFDIPTDEQTTNGNVDATDVLLGTQINF
jgi:hypothetical protein